MRVVLLSLILGTPAAAWEATVGQICTLSHVTDTAEIFLTYDPAKPLYTLSVTRKTEGWTNTPWFAMRFQGPNPIEIATPHHVLSDGASMLTVTDTGFGNVLDGLQYNAFGAGHSGDISLQFSLTDAAEPVAAFRDCGDLALS